MHSSPPRLHFYKKCNTYFIEGHTAPSWPSTTRLFCTTSAPTQFSR